MFLKNLKKKYLEAKKLAKKNKKKIAFIIGNTIKIEKGSYPTNFQLRSSREMMFRAQTREMMFRAQTRILTI